MPMHKQREAKASDEAADFAHRSRNPVACRPHLNREYLRRVNKGRSVGTKLGEEITETVDEQESDGQLFYIGDDSQQAKSAGHHAEAEALDSLAAHLIHHPRRDRVAGCGKDYEDAQLCEGFLQNRVIAAQS